MDIRNPRCPACGLEEAVGERRLHLGSSPCPTDLGEAWPERLCLRLTYAGDDLDVSSTYTPAVYICEGVALARTI